MALLNEMMIFEISGTKLEMLNEWKEKINDLFGEYGDYEYRFTPGGIGTIIKVFSYLTRTELDLSEVEKW